jgi:hypothetical protein
LNGTVFFLMVSVSVESQEKEGISRRNTIFVRVHFYIELYKVESFVDFCLRSLESVHCCIYKNLINGFSHVTMQHDVRFFHEKKKKSRLLRFLIDSQPCMKQCILSLKIDQLIWPV